MKVLFVLQSIGYGGSMTSLLNLLSLLKDRNIFEIEVLFMDPYGELIDEAKSVSKVCKQNTILEVSTMSRKSMLDKRLYWHYFLRLILAIRGKIRRCSSTEIGFDKAAKRYDNKFDCVVAYQESVATNFAIRIKAARHIAWVHNDYNNVKKIYGGQEECLRSVYSQYDKIICVSHSGALNFKKYSGVDSKKITYIYNTLPFNEIKRKASVPLIDVLNRRNPDEVLIALQSKCIKFVSSGRFAKQKCFERVVNAAKKMKDKGYHFKWIIIGTGDLFEEIKASIISLDLTDDVLLTGGLTNPFPIVKACDFFVLTSDFEAHPMVANEALILGTPVITTNFESAKEVVKNGETGLICEMNVDSIVESLQSLLENVELRERLRKNVSGFIYSNEVIIQQVISEILNDDKVS